MNIIDFLLSDNKISRHKPWFIDISDDISRRMCAGAIVIGSCISVLMTLFWWFIGTFDFLHKDLFTQTDLHYAGGGLFFSIICGYAIGICVHLNCLAIAYIDALRILLPPRFSADGDHEALKTVIKQVPRNAWILCTLAGTGFGLLLCFVYGGASEPLFKDMLVEPHNYTTAQIALPLHAILFWALVFQGLFCLIKNGLIFSELGKEVKIDLLNIGTLKPFGHVASRNATLVIVTFALMPLLSLGEPMWWGDILVAVLFLIPLAGAMFYLPINQVGKRVKEVKILELKQIHSALSGNHAVLANGSIASETGHFGLHELLIWRNEIKQLPELPVKFGVFTEIGLHLCGALLISVGAWFFTILRLKVPH